MTSQLQAVLRRVDEANARDPNLERAEGRDEPAALLYGRRMSEMLVGFVERPSAELQIAVRGQHIERWLRPRGDYPDGRAGYLQWRRDAAEFHARRLGELMAAEGFDEPACSRVGVLVRKISIKTDPEVQALEDVAGLVFMRWYFAGFAARRSPDELFQIVAKTARKMSAEGRKEALRFPLPSELLPAISGTDR